MNQITGNTAILETGELFTGTKSFDVKDKVAIIRKTHNLLNLLHAVLVGDKLYYIPFAATKVHNANKGVIYMHKHSPLKDFITPLDFTEQDEQDALKIAREKIADKADQGMLGDALIEMSKEMSFCGLIKEEIDLYFPQGFDHYWNNLGMGNNGYSKLDSYAINLYTKFEKAFAFTKTITEKGKSIFDYSTEAISNYEKDINRRDYLLKYRWLGFFSHIVRAWYLVNVSKKHGVIYMPLGTKTMFIKRIVQNDPYINKHSYETTLKLDLMIWAFNYVLKKSHYKPLGFLTVLMAEKNNKPLSDIGNILKRMSEEKTTAAALKKDLDAIKTFFAKENFETKELGIKTLISIFKNEKINGVLHIEIDELTPILNRIPQEYFINYITS
jgi:hypothetical protein